MWRILCALVLPWAAVTCSGHARLDSDTSDGCPAFDRRLCEGGPSHESRDALECLSSHGCAAGQRCCSSCNFGFKICIRTALAALASENESHQASEFCPKVRPCSSPLKYDVRYRCGSDQVCPFGYKCCRGDCYIHRVCILPTDASGNHVAPSITTGNPPTEPTQTLLADEYSGSGSGADDDDPHLEQLPSVVLGFGGFNIKSTDDSSLDIAVSQKSSSDYGSSADKKIGKAYVESNDFEIQFTDDFYRGATTTDYSSSGAGYIDGDDDNFLPGPDSSSRGFTDDYATEGSGSGNYEDDSKMFTASSDSNNSDFHWANSENKIISSTTASDIIKKDTIVCSKSRARPSNVTIEPAAEKVNEPFRDTNIKNETDAYASGSGDYRTDTLFNLEFDYSGSGDDNEEREDAIMVSSTPKEAFTVVTPLTPIFLSEQPITLRTTFDNKDYIIFIDDYDLDNNDLSAILTTTIKNIEESGSGSGDWNIDKDDGEGSGSDDLHSMQYLTTGAILVNNFSLPEKDYIEPTSSGTEPSRDTISSNYDVISKESTSTEHLIELEFSGSGDWEIDEDTQLLYFKLPNLDNKSDTFNGSGDYIL